MRIMRLPLFLGVLCLMIIFHAADCASAMEYSLQKGTLSCDNRPILQNVPKGFALVEDPAGVGVFLRFTAGASSSILQSPLGKIDGLSRFTSAHRNEAFWMQPAVGTSHADVRYETQWLLAETKSGDCAMIVPLIDGAFRFSISGGNAGLVLTGETGDPFTYGTGGVALFVMVGRDPYAMAESGAKAVMNHLGTGKLRVEKPLPDFVDLFGWCTWDAFYKEVSADNVRIGLESFKAGGVEPRFLILDDGWQDYKRMPTGEDRLVSLGINKRFNGDLTPTVQLAKKDFKIRVFLVWHAMNGYWGGVDGKSLADYEVRDLPKLFGPGILHQDPEANEKYWGPLVGLMSAEKIGKFMDDYHQRLTAQGVDGVKVDNQAVLEGLAVGQGGRVALTRAYRQAL
jgi:raffinose synthase